MGIEQDGVSPTPPENQSATTAPKAYVDPQALNADKLPQDLGRLTALRDQLSDYLATLERNTKAVSDWLAENEQIVVVQHHRLLRAVKNGNEAVAMDILANAGEAVGFMLDITDFRDLGVERFGANSTFVKMVDTAEKGVPSYLLEDLPQVDLTTEADVGAAILPQSLPQAPQPAKKTVWNKLFGTQSKEEKEQQRQEEERKAQEERMLDYWRNVRSELISLQSDRHYYVDSFMDWVEAGLTSEKTLEEAEPLLYSYQEPSYVIDLAQKDYAQVTEGRTQALREKTQAYSAIAALFDNKNVDGIIRHHKSLDTRVSGKTYRDMLMSDPHYQGSNLAEVALAYIDKREDQFKLFRHAIVHEKITFKNGVTKQDAFEEILDEVLVSTNPLNPQALSLIMGYIDAADAPEDYNAYRRIYDRLRDDPTRLLTVMTEYMVGLAQETSAVTSAFVGLDEALASENDDNITTMINAIKLSGNGLKVRALWDLCKAPPIASALGRSDKANTTGKRSVMLDHYIKMDEAGLIDIRHSGSDANTDFLIGNLVLNNLQDTSPENISNTRKLIATLMAKEDLSQVNQQYIESHLSRIWRADIAENKAILWTAVFMETFPSDIQKANILARTAEAIHEPRLLKLEEQFASSHIRLDAETVGYNIDRIANIWHDSKSAELKYTVAGEAPRTFMANIDAIEARDILDYLVRKHGLEREYNGAFNPANIDRFTITSRSEAYIGWGGPQNVGITLTSPTLRAIMKDPRFIGGNTEDSDDLILINTESVAIVQDLGQDRVAIIDNYGNPYRLKNASLDNLVYSSDWLKIGDTHINPDRISVISTDMAKNEVDLRIESTFFERVFQAPNNFATVSDISSSEMAKLETALRANESIISHDDGSNEYFFNIRKSGFIAFEPAQSDKEISYFHYLKYGALHSTVAIPASDPETVPSLYKSALKKKDLITVRNTTFSPDSIENIYYSAKEGALCIQATHSMQKIRCGDTYEEALKTAEKVIARVLEMRPDLYALNYSLEDGSTRMLDLVDMSKPVMLQYNAAEDRVIAHSSLRNPIHILMDETDGPAFITAIEDLGRADNKMDLTSALKQLPQVYTKLQPALSSPGTAYLMDVLSDQQNGMVSISKVAEQFAKAHAYSRTNAPATNDNVRNAFVGRLRSLPKAKTHKPR